MTAIEIETAINDQLETGKAEVIRDIFTYTNFINIRTNTPGLSGSIQVTGGTANAAPAMAWRLARFHLRDFVLPFYGGEAGFDVTNAVLDVAGNAITAISLSSLDSQPIDTKAPTVLTVTDNISGTAKIGERDYFINLNSSPSTIEAMNDLPAFRDWTEAGLAETLVIEKFEQD